MRFRSRKESFTCRTRKKQNKSTSMKHSLEFKQIDRNNWEEVLKIEVLPEQREFAPTVAESLAAAYIKPWDEAFDIFAIYADNILAGIFYISYTPESKDNYWIGGFQIDKQYQNKGIGREALIKILDFIPKQHPRCKEMKLTVEKNNTVAQKLYKSLGFDDTGEVNKYDEIIYTIPAQEQQ